MSVETILAFRFIVAIILIWMYVFFQKLSFKLPLKNIGYLLFLGVLTIGTRTFMYESYKYIPGAIASLLAMLYVVLVVIIEIFIGRDKPHLSKLGSVLLATLGLIAVVWTPKGYTSLHPLGILFGCFAGLCYALYAIGLGGKSTRATKPEIATAYSLLPVGLFSVVRCIANQQPIIPNSYDQWTNNLTTQSRVALIRPSSPSASGKQLMTNINSRLMTLSQESVYLYRTLILNQLIITKSQSLN